MSKETDDILIKTQQVAIELTELRDAFDRHLNEMAKLREAVNNNADLYRRDMQYVIDLFGDWHNGELSLDGFRTQLLNTHAMGKEELLDAHEGALQ